MAFYFIGEAPDHIVTTDEGWLSVEFDNAGAALRYLTKVEKWAKETLKSHEEIVWTIDMNGPVLSVWFSNPRSVTLLSLSGITYDPYSR